MKKQNFLLVSFILLSLLELFNFQCIPSKNCPPGKGRCINNSCHCFPHYWTLLDSSLSKNETQIFCNYKKYNRYIALAFEIFIPSSGHLYTGRYIHFILKLSLIVICIFLFFYDFQKYKQNNIDEDADNDENIHFNSREEDTLVEENDNPKKNIDKVTSPNHENQGLSWESYAFPGCLICFILMYFIDLICYGFGFYKDGKGVPAY